MKFDLKPEGTYKYDAVSLGEVMLRLDPGEGRIRTARSFRAWEGGGEYNVIRGLHKCFGMNTAVITAFADNEVGKLMKDFIEQGGVGTDLIYWKKTDGIGRICRNGLNFTERGFGIRGAMGCSDRANTAISQATPEDFDFDSIFRDADWFHWSGITPALSKNMSECVRLACIAAKKAGVTISCDLNYRHKLWSAKEAQEVMCPLMEFVDVCIGNEEDAEKCLGFRPEADIEHGKTDADGYKSIFQGMVKKFGFKYVVGTLRESFSASHNGWKALIYDGKEFYESRRYEINPIVDRVGGGDSFSAGIIHGLANGKPMDWTLEFAVAASALKHTIPGDVNMVSLQEVESLMNGNGNGRVER